MRLLDERAAIYFDMTDVDGTNARLVVDDGSTVSLADLTAVRITASVQSDDRVVYEAEKQDTAGSSQTITRTVRAETNRWVKRDASSVYSSEGTGIIRDDSTDEGPMADLASRCREQMSPLVSDVSFSVPWLDFTYHLGECVTDVSGRDVRLLGTGESESSAQVIEGITYDLGSQTTDLQFRPLGSRS